MNSYRLTLIAAACIHLTLTACASGGTGRARSAETGPKVEVTAQSLNVRATPSTTGAVVGSLQRGELARITKPAADGWVHVESDSGVSGYVSANFVKEVEPAAGSSAAPEPAQVSKPVSPDSKLAKIRPGMFAEDVRAQAGPPDDQNSYITGKSFIPYYYGPDTSRTEWVYYGQGVVVFSRNRWTGQLKVVEVRGE